MKQITMVSSMAVLVRSVVLADIDFVHWDTLDLFEAAKVKKL